MDEAQLRDTCATINPALTEVTNSHYCGGLPSHAIRQRKKLALRNSLRRLFRPSPQDGEGISRVYIAMGTMKTAWRYKEEEKVSWGCAL